MKIKIILISFLFTCNLFAQKEHVKVFPFKSAVIEYKYEAALGGTHIKYIDDYGYKQADYIKKEIHFGDETEKKYETIILIGEKAYTIDFQDSTLAVGRNASYGYYIQYQDHTCTEVSEALFTSTEGWKFEGKTVFLDKECKIWRAGNNTQLTWKGVLLKSEINFMIMMVEKAINIKTDIDIPANKFEIPQGFKYISSDVYQGFSGLKLNFDKTTSNSEPNRNGLTVTFNSADLEACDNFTYFSENGERILIKGVNDYNKIDPLIINSQKEALSSEEVALLPAGTLIFKTAVGYPGKMQIKDINKDGFEYRYVVFNHEGTIRSFSDGTQNGLSEDFDIRPDKDNYKLIIKPKDKAEAFVLGW